MPKNTADCYKCKENKSHSRGLCQTCYRRGLRQGWIKKKPKNIEVVLKGIADYGPLSVQELAIKLNMDEQNVRQTLHNAGYSSRITQGG